MKTRAEKVDIINAPPLGDGSPWERQIIARQLKREILSNDPIERGILRAAEAINLPLPIEIQESLANRENVINEARHVLKFAHTISHYYRTDRIYEDADNEFILNVIASMSPRTLTGDEYLLGKMHDQIDIMRDSIAVVLEENHADRKLFELLDDRFSARAPLTTEEFNQITTACLVGILPNIPTDLLPKFSPGVLRHLFSLHNTLRMQAVGVYPKDDKIYPPLATAISIMSEVANMPDANPRSLAHSFRHIRQKFTNDEALYIRRN